MIEGKIWLAVKSPLLSFTEYKVVFSEDAAYNPVANTPFIYVQPVWQEYPDEVLSFDCGNEYRGFLNLAVRVPVTWDYAAHMGLANRAMASYQYGAQYEYDNITVQIHERPHLFGSSYLDTSHNRIDARIPFRCWG